MLNCCEEPRGRTYFAHTLRKAIDLINKAYQEKNEEEIQLFSQITEIRNRIIKNHAESILALEHQISKVKNHIESDKERPSRVLMRLLMERNNTNNHFDRMMKNFDIEKFKEIIYDNFA